MRLASLEKSPEAHDPRATWQAPVSVAMSTMAVRGKAGVCVVEGIGEYDAALGVGIQDFDRFPGIAS